MLDHGGVHRSHVVHQSAVMPPAHGEPLGAIDVDAVRLKRLRDHEPVAVEVEQKRI